MTGNYQPTTQFRAENSDNIIVESLDMITLIYQKRSGITHLVAEPMPQILAALGGQALDIAALIDRLATKFDLDPNEQDTHAVIAARIDELMALGLVVAEGDADA